MFCTTAAKKSKSPVPTLDAVTADRFLTEAIRRWDVAGVTDDNLAKLEKIEVEIADLPGKELARLNTVGDRLYLDFNGAGVGWFKDSTPTDDSEHKRAGDQGERNRVDVLSVVLHETGFVLGMAARKNAVMDDKIGAGVRRVEVHRDHAGKNQDRIFGKVDDNPTLHQNRGAVQTPGDDAAKVVAVLKQSGKGNSGKSDTKAAKVEDNGRPHGPGHALMAVGSPKKSKTAPAAVDSTKVQQFLGEAMNRWRSSGVSETALAALAATTIRVADLPGKLLGWTSETGEITIDSNAAGFGWFVDATPGDDGEYQRGGDQGERDRMDLLTVVMHEAGHFLELGHVRKTVMEDSLKVSERRTNFLRKDAGAVEDRVFGVKVDDNPGVHQNRGGRGAATGTTPRVDDNPGVHQNRGGRGAATGTTPRVDDNPGVHQNRGGRGAATGTTPRVDDNPGVHQNRGGRAAAVDRVFGEAHDMGDDHGRGRGRGGR